MMLMRYSVETPDGRECRLFPDGDPLGHHRNPLYLQFTSYLNVASGAACLANPIFYPLNVFKAKTVSKPSVASLEAVVS